MAKTNKTKGRRRSGKKAATHRKARRMPKIEVAQRDLMYTIPANHPQSFIDSARGFSRVNRRKYDQGMLYGFQGLTFVFRPDGTATQLEVKVKTAGSSWIVHNSFVKGKAMWEEMRQLVLDDNPSLAGKWEDFKVQLHQDHVDAKTLSVVDGAGVPLTTVGAEWTLSVYVMPQHVVDPATGLPLPAEEFTAMLIGPHTGTRKSLATAYQASRATVSPDQPNTPGAMATSFFNLLTDSGSQEPELATRIEVEDDNPPYDLEQYPGADVNANVPYVQGFAAVSSAEVDGRVGPFTAECGLIELEVTARNASGEVVTNPEIDVILHGMPGPYKGLAAIKMGQ